MSDPRSAGTLIGMHTRRDHRSPLAAASFALLLCSCGEAQDAPKNLGNTDEESVVGEAPPPVRPRDFLGTWIGEVEDPLAVAEGSARTIHQFPSGSTQVRLEYVLAPEQGEGYARGTLTFGAGSPPPSPPDLDVGYPPGAGYFDGTESDLIQSALLPPTEGYPYTVSRGSDFYDVTTLIDDELSPGFIRFWFTPHELFNDWCTQQVPHLVDEVGRYSCVRGYMANTPRDANGHVAQCTIVPVLFPEAPRTRGIPPEPVDCDKLYLCDPLFGPPVCACLEEGCFVDYLPVGLFLRFDGDELVGSFTQGLFRGKDGHISTLGAVRFRRE
jgi:hypothetical protein